MKQAKKNAKPALARRRASKKAGRGVQSISAPANISGDVTQFTRFSSSARGLRMHTRAPICTIGNKQIDEDGYTSYGGIIGGLNNSYVSATGLQLNLTAPGFFAETNIQSGQSYLSPVWDCIASAFVRYRVHGLKFFYSPQCATSETQRLVFAFAEDPCHPNIIGNDMYNETLLTLGNSIAFAPWQPWSLDVTKDLRRSELLYTYDPVNATSGSNTMNLLNRFSDFGSVGCTVSSPLETGRKVYGVLYMELDISLEEFCPIVRVGPSEHYLVKQLSDLSEETRQKVLSKVEQNIAQRKSESEKKRSSSPKGDSSPNSTNRGVIYRS